MNNYNNRESRGSGKYGGRSNFTGDRKRGGGGRDRDDRPMQKFSATCASCKKKCEVPFRPSGERPVYCSNCFTQRNDGGNRGGKDAHSRSSAARGRSSYDRKQGDDGEMKQRLATIESKLNRILGLLNPPTGRDKVSKGKRASKKEVDVVAVKKVVEKAIKKDAKKKVVKKKVTKTTKMSVKKTKVKKK